MTDIPMKHYWCGEDIDCLPREKLLQIIAMLSRQLEESRRINSATHSIYEAASRARRNAA